MATAILDGIPTLAIAHQRFNLRRCEEPDFFPEWQRGLSPLPPEAHGQLQTLRQRYLYQRTAGQLLEGAVILLLVSPLLAIAGFYDPPFLVRSEASIRLELADQGEILQGRLDVLVVQDGFWIVVVEAKKTALSLWSALPQTLAYLMGNPHPERPSFGLISNGDDLLFVKLHQGESPQYGLSRVFSPFAAAAELEQAGQILKTIADQLPSATPT